MPSFRNHRIVAIASTLAVASRMHVNIGHNRQIEAAALVPHKTKLSAIKLHNSVREARGIDIVVIEE
jgi:hypothetical protein